MSNLEEAAEKAKQYLLDKEEKRKAPTLEELNGFGLALAGITGVFTDADFEGFEEMRDDHHNCKKRIAELEEKAGKINLTIARMVE